MIFGKGQIIYFTIISLLSGGCNDEQNTGETPSKPELVLRLATGSNHDTVGWNVVDLVRKELERQSGGRVQVNLYDSGVLGSGSKLLGGAYFEVIEMICIISAFVNKVNPAFGILDLPYLFYDEEHQKRVLSGSIGKELLVCPRI